MSLIEDIEAKIKSNPMYGIHFSIDPDAYLCSIEDGRVVFGESYHFENSGTEYNYQPIIIDGYEVGTLEEIVPWHPFSLEPMRTSFILHLDEGQVTNKIRKSPHFVIGYYEQPQMRFATLQQFIDNMNIN